MQTVKDIFLDQKKIFLRAGFDVPIEAGEILEKGRILAGIPTLKYLLQKKCRIILAFHIGRPEGKCVPALGVGPVCAELSRILKMPIRQAPGCVDSASQRLAQGLRPGGILVLENLRFYRGEEENDLVFAQKLRLGAQVFVQDAFSVLHRAHASVVALPQFCQQSKKAEVVAGLLVEREANFLRAAQERPAHPAVVVIGGAKTETKIPVIKNLLRQGFDRALVGGVVANNFLAILGRDLQDSLVDQDHLAVTKALWQEFPGQIIVPQDSLWNIQKQIYDIGPQTIEHYTKIIRKAKTIVWNGPLGVFEQAPFAQGTQKIAEAILAARARNVVGGGDTVMALQKFKLYDQFDFVSTGGGVMLEFLAGKELPGLKILES